MSIKMFVPLSLTEQQERSLGAEIAAAAKALAAERGIVAPKSVNYFGCYGDWIVFKYKTNAFRDCLVQAIQSRKIEYMFL